MRKILFSVMTLVLVIGLVGGGAFAYLSDTETSTGNIFTAGTLDLKIDDNPDGAVFNWVDDPDLPTIQGCMEECVNNLQPGESVMVIVGIKNAGTCSGIADIHIRNVVDDDNGLTEPEEDDGDTTGGAVGGELSSNINVVISYGDKSLIGDQWQMWTPVHSGTLHDLDCVNINAPATAGMPQDEDDYWVLEFSIPGTVGNIIQSDKVTFDIEFTLHQEVPQP